MTTKSASPAVPHLRRCRRRWRHRGTVRLQGPRVTRPRCETLLHASFGAGGMALADISSLTASKHLRLVAVADVDLNRTAEVRKRFPNVRVYQDWRELLDKEKDLTSANISTPDHMHAAITMRGMQRACTSTRRSRSRRRSMKPGN